MGERSKSREVIPDEFSTIEEAAAFWESHDFADYWDETSEVEVDIQAPRRQWVALATHVATQTAERARQEGVTIETLVNLWIAERLVAES